MRQSPRRVGARSKGNRCEGIRQSPSQAVTSLRQSPGSVGTRATGVKGSDIAKRSNQQALDFSVTVDNRVEALLLHRTTSTKVKRRLPM